MNTSEFYTPSFFQRHYLEIKEITVMLCVILFGFSYRSLQPVHAIVDKGVDPAVAGITDLYGHFSSLVYRFTKVDLGFVSPPPDQEFLFNVRMASYINERSATPLLDISVDDRFSEEKRERAMKAILKFETTADWIQPFLNELPKGGLLGLYDDQSPLLDELIKKIREEGGVRQPMVRAYAEVVFSFMLQVPDLVIRLHALRWVSDVIAEDAIFLIIPRLGTEKDPQAQLAIEQALFDIRAVSESDTARELLIPYYRKPPWPTARLPLGAVLARLGYDGAAQYVAAALQSEKITKEERMALRLANEGTRYPAQLKISEKEERLLADRRKMRQEQARAAQNRRDQIIRQEHIKKSLIAHAEKTSLPSEPVAPPTSEESAPQNRSMMNYVDVVFEVKDDEAPLFQNPGEGATATILPVGTKGKANFEVMYGEEHWYQVKSKKGHGWANGKNLLISNPPVAAKTPAVTKKTESSKEETVAGERKESTYFAAASDDVDTFESPSEKTKKTGKLTPDLAYLAIRSEKVGADRWFLLQTDPGETAWVRGIDLRLSDAQ